jgi:hypothetical protein
MRPTWLIEANVDGLPTEALQFEIRRQGMKCYVIKYLPNLPAPKDIAGSEHVPFDACVVFRGSLPLMRHIQASRRWRPGGWCSFANLACSTYYSYFGPFLLNREYTMLPVAEAARLTDSLFARHGNGEVVFVRPDSVDKSFTGTVADKFSFLQTIAGAAFDPTTLILVARPKRLSYEWRLVVAGDNAIAGSQYRTGKVAEVVAGCPDEVKAFAATVLEQVEWRPAPLFIMDICDSEEGLRLLELNSFGCSGHYLADLEVVVEKASEAARLSW